MRVDGLLDRLAQVLPEVEPVRDLNRVRGAGAGTFAIAAGAVAADHLNFGVLPQPRGEAGAVTAVEHVNRTVADHID